MVPAMVPYTVPGPWATTCQPSEGAYSGAATDLVLPPKNVPGYNPETFRTTLLDREQTPSRRIWAARRVAFYQRREPIAINSLQMGDICIL